jgi:hypothetical protein
MYASHHAIEHVDLLERVRHFCCHRIHVCVCVCVSVCACVCVCVCNILFSFPASHHVTEHGDLLERVRTYTTTRSHMYIHARTHTYAYMHTHTYTNTHKHTHPHTHGCCANRSGSESVRVQRRAGQTLCCGVLYTIARPFPSGSLLSWPWGSPPHASHRYCITP